MKPNRRQFLAGGSFWAASTVLSAPAIAKPTKTLRFLPISDLTGIDPVWTTSTAVRNHGYLVYDTLFGTDAQFNVRPQMAESAETSPDGLTVTIKLRSGLKFHDGTPVLARDCVQSIQRWAAKDATGQIILSLTDELSAVDDRTLRFRLKSAFPPLLAALGQLSSPGPFMMPESVARTDPNTKITNSIGSGPFRFLEDEWVQGSRVAYAKFDGYVPRSETASGTAGGKRALVDRVEWNIVPDASTAVAAIQTGEADWYEYAAVDLIPTIAKNKDVVVSTLDPVGYPVLIRLNHLQPPFNNPALRRAVLAAVNQTELLQAAVGDMNYATVCKSFLPCGTPMSTGAGSEVMTGDLAAARKAVAAAAYDGTKAVILSASDNPVLSSFSLVIEDLFKKIGITPDLQSMDIATMIQRRSSVEPVSNGGWSLFVTYGESTQFSNPGTHIALRSDGRAAWPGWPTDPKIQELRMAFLYAPDADRLKIAGQIEKAAFDNVPYIPGGQIKQPTIYRKSLSGILTIGMPLFWNILKA